MRILSHIGAHIWKTGGYFFPLLYICLLCDKVLLPWKFRSPGFDIRAPRFPWVWRKGPPGPPQIAKDVLTLAAHIWKTYYSLFFHGVHMSPVWWGSPWIQYFGFLSLLFIMKYIVPKLTNYVMRIVSAPIVCCEFYFKMFLGPWYKVCIKCLRSPCILI